MKKILLSASAVTLLIGAASCSQEEVANPALNGDGNVNITLSLPGGMGTRAFADGLTANDLEMAVYDAETNNLVYSPAPVSFNNSLTTTVSLNLANGRAYKIAFFAHKKGGAYSFSAEDKQITVDYSAMNTTYNTDDFDCFYTLYTTGVITGPISDNVTLSRPVAQVNWGTADLKDPSVTATSAYDIDDNGEAKNLVTKITTKAYTQFSLLDSDVVASSETDVVLPHLARPAGQTFPVDPSTYSYVSMQYLMMPKASTLVDITLEATNAPGAAALSTVTVTNAPVQANYRTNIYGKLLVNSADFNVSKEPNFDGEYPVTPGEFDETALSKGGVVTVATPVEEITIPASLDAPLTLLVNQPIGKINLPASNDQAITVNVAKDIDYPEFAFTANSTIKDFTLKGDPTSSKTTKGFIFLSTHGVEVTHSVRPAMLENFTLDGINFEGGGFIPQYTVSTKNIVIKNCKFTDCVAPAVGIQHARGGKDETAEGLTIENCEISYAASLSSSVNALYILDVQGNIAIKDNVIKDMNYHGIFVSCDAESNGNIAHASSIEISGNTISGSAARDGIKIENEKKAAISITDNNIIVSENAIRVKNALDGNSLVLTDNTLDMQNAKPYSEADGEPCAILLINSTENTETASVAVDNNTVLNSNGHDVEIKNVKR